jgi:acyl-CoA thioesterase-1
MTTIRRTITILALAVLVLTAGVVGGNSARTAQAGPLAGSTWCAYRDSMAIFGGSSATGYLTTGYTNSAGTYQPTQYGWWKQVTDFAAANWGTVSHNYARNGASFASYLNGGQWDVTRNAVTALGETQPDLLFLALGTNEYLAQTSPDVMEANMRQVVDNVKAASPRTAIMAIVQQTAYAGTNPTYTWEKYKQRIMQVVIDEHLAMADLRQSVPSAYNTDWQRWYHPDRIHMLDTTHMTFAAGVRPWLFFC